MNEEGSYLPPGLDVCSSGHRCRPAGLLPAGAARSVFPKATEVGADVVREFVDRGESARSADRPALQELLSWVEAEGDVDYCIVHKVDRWARNRHDDVLMDLALRAAGTQLVSATENIDETPSGMLVRGIMASIAEFYSRNLATEAMKGMQQKAKVGGTPGKAPIGYLNVRQRIDGREIRTVAVDPERAPLVRWAFAAYASGEWTARALLRELTDRGLRTVPTPTRPPAPLQLSNVAKILTNRYYLGYVTFLGLEYEGRHEPLITAELFQQVQVMLRAKATAEERHWRHQHYLKGSLFCGRCGARLSLQWAKGRYLYFFCLGRQRGSGCEQPYVAADAIEEEVARHYEVIQFEPDRLAFLRRRLGEEIEVRRKSARRVVAARRSAWPSSRRSGDATPEVWSTRRSRPTSPERNSSASPRPSPRPIPCSPNTGSRLLMWSACSPRRSN